MAQEQPPKDMVDKIKELEKRIKKLEDKAAKTP